MWELMGLKQNGIFLLAALVGSAGAIAVDKVYISVDELGQPVASGRAPVTSTFDRSQAGTRYILLVVRTFANFNDPTDLQAANALQDRVNMYDVFGSHNPAGSHPT